MTPRRFQARRIQIWLAAAGALLALAFLPAAASADRPYDVLIVKADGGNNPFELEAALQAQPDVSNVAVYDTNVFTPLLSLLEDYDVVIAYSSTDYASATNLGNTLANYIDGGGVVVPVAFDGITTPNRSLAGRWITDEYRPWMPGATVNSTTQTLGAHDVAHPFFQGVTALSAMYRISDVTPAPGATLLASWSGGSPLVAVKGRVVGINARLGSNEWSGDFARLIVNAANSLYPQPAPPAEPTPTPTPTTADTTKPTITGLSFKPKAFRTAAPRSKSGGTKISFRLSEPATVRLTIQRRAQGRKSGRKCVAPRPTNRTASPCVRWLKVPGQIERAGVTGSNSFRFTGRLAGRKLAPGSYRAVSVATDAAGNRSVLTRHAFNVLAPKVRR
ncbi:MAG TPA: hypothetical protein VEW67_09215 [Thermoleophilaceae bacterium]|nr:hypothetical protein [Thermoleophilaceae bacterium]